jgi:hypothetical protein
MLYKDLWHCHCEFPKKGKVLNEESTTRKIPVADSKNMDLGTVYIKLTPKTTLKLKGYTGSKRTVFDFICIAIGRGDITQSCHVA